jgi:hypothetical protein
MTCIQVNLLCISELFSESMDVEATVTPAGETKSGLSLVARRHARGAEGTIHTSPSVLHEMFCCHVMRLKLTCSPVASLASPTAMGLDLVSLVRCGADGAAQQRGRPDGLVT